MLQVRTGGRLHLGLMELAAGETLRFGGLGLMLSSPQLVLEFSAAGARCQCPPPAEEIPRRIAEVQQRWNRDRPEAAACQVSVIESLPLHRGLGAGTQLAAATAVGLELFARLHRGELRHENLQHWQPVSATTDFLSPQWLVRQTGRGLRSAVGLQGFVHGGLVLDEGYPPAAQASHGERPIASCSHALPAQWQAVLICPPAGELISGAREAELLAAIGRQPNPAKLRMFALARQAVAVGQQGQDFEGFTELLDEYMDLAGQVFARSQGGMYNGLLVTQAVAAARTAGLRAVGQSSWGPTVFGFAPHKPAAEQAVNRLRDLCPQSSVSLSPIASQGVYWRCLPP
ncbi:MAG: hypothetical protein KDA45_02700 [Planctomycetales bacterium]|nr:hypothetical protein [Planctomycetales bacterium]